MELNAVSVALLLAVSAGAGVVNTLAGGGSLVTVPMLVLLGLPGTIANGTNRVGILVQSLSAGIRFHGEGVSGWRDSVPALVPVVLGSAIGAVVIARVSDAFFERAFAVAMLLLLVPTLRGAGRAAEAGSEVAKRWSRGTTFIVFFAIGVYGGAIQAGVGFALIFALSRAGYDLVRANSVKVVVLAAFTAVAVAVFVIEGLIDWPVALVLCVGFAFGGTLGARLAVVAGERLIRPVLAVAVVAMSGRLLGLY